MTYEEIREKIAASYRSGKTIQQIARDWHMSPYAVARYVEDAMDKDE